MRLDAEIRGREAERPAALVSDDDDPVDLGRPAEDPGRACDVSLVQQLADPVDDAPSTGGTRTTEKPMLLEERRGRLAAGARSGSRRPATTTSAPIAPQHALGELLGLLLLQGRA